MLQPCGPSTNNLFPISHDSKCRGSRSSNPAYAHHVSISLDIFMTSLPPSVASFPRLPPSSLRSLTAPPPPRASQEPAPYATTMLVSGAGRRPLVRTCGSDEPTLRHSGSEGGPVYGSSSGGSYSRGMENGEGEGELKRSPGS